LEYNTINTNLVVINCLPVFQFTCMLGKHVLNIDLTNCVSMLKRHMGFCEARRESSQGIVKMWAIFFNKQTVKA